MQDQRVLNWLFPSQSGQLQQGYEDIGALFGWGSGPGSGGPPPGPPNQPGFPPSGGSGFGPGGGVPPWQPGGQEGPPPGPPPARPPVGPQSDEIEVFAVDPGAFRRCLYRYTFVRLDNGRRFWFWPTFIGRRSVAGYRWRPRQYRWVYMGIDTERIRSFECS